LLPHGLHATRPSFEERLGPQDVRYNHDVQVSTAEGLCTQL